MPSTIDNLQIALTNIQQLKQGVTQFFIKLNNGFTEDENLKFIMEMHEMLQAVNLNLVKLNDALQQLKPLPNKILKARNDALTLLESTQGYYGKLIHSYKNLDMMQESARYIVGLVEPESTVKRYYCSEKSKKSVINETDVATLDKLFLDMKLKLTKLSESYAVLEVTLGSVLKGIFVFSGVLMEYVQIRGFNENFRTDENEIDIWAESKYNVFKKITENCTQAMLIFYHESCFPLADDVHKTYMTWFHSYITLFSEKCKYCGKHLSDFLPPTWRDLKTYYPIHEGCRT